MKRDPITRTCRTNFRAWHHEGQRLHQSVKYIVLHSTEGETAAGAAEWFQSKDCGGSSNIVVDDNQCYRVLTDLVIPWGAPPLNTHGFHIEQAGYARWSRKEWLKHEATIERAAYKAAIRCRDFKIPARFLNAHDLEDDFGTDLNGRLPQTIGPMTGGITTHHVIDEVYGLSDHTDPGDGYPIDVFMAHLHNYLSSGHV
jgi:hypothetical protein